jgi:hypothetical protein
MKLLLIATKYFESHRAGSISSPGGSSENRCGSGRKDCQTKGALVNGATTRRPWMQLHRGTHWIARGSLIMGTHEDLGNAHKLEQLAILCQPPKLSAVFLLDRSSKRSQSRLQI